MPTGFCGPAAHSSALSRSRAGSPGASSSPSSGGSRRQPARDCSVTSSLVDSSPFALTATSSRPSPSLSGCRLRSSRHANWTGRIRSFRSSSPYARRKRPSVRSGARAHRLEVTRLDFLEWAVLSNRSVFKPQRAAAEACEHRVIVPGGDDDASCLEDPMCALLQEVPELVVERLMNLVEDEDVRLALLSDRESEPSLHALGVGQYRTFERFTEGTPGLHVAQGAHRGTTRKPSEDAEEQCVLAAGEQRQQPGIDRKQRRHASGDFNPAVIGRVNAGKDT